VEEKPIVVKYFLVEIDCRLGFRQRNPTGAVTNSWILYSQ